MNAKLENSTLFWLMLLTTVGFVFILQPFFAPIFWACAVAIIFYPLQQRLLPKFKNRRNVTAVVTLMISLIIVIIPVIFIITSVVAQGIALYEQLDEGDINLQQIVEELTLRVPYVGTLLERFDVQLDEIQGYATEAAMAAGSFLAERSLVIGQNAFRFFLSLFIMIYLTFFMLRDGRRIVTLIKQALPLGKERKRLLFQKFTEVTRATIKGNIIIAAIEGGLGGLIFWFLGVPAPLLWGVVMAFISLIPAIGAGLIWGPVAIYLLAVGDYVNAIILIAFGSIVIGLVDNLLRPILVGRDTRMPDYIILLSTLGGIALLGINGFVIGPLIAAMFIAVWGIFSREYQAAEETKSESL